MTNIKKKCITIITKLSRSKLSISIIVLLFLGCDSKPKHENGIQWIYQVDSLLMPYWMMDEALGEPAGNFPNYRNDKGQVIGYDNFEFNSVPDVFKEFLIQQPDSLRRNYIRVNSRQIYTYCVAFHMTGNEEYLYRAKIGIDFLFENGGYDSGSPFTFWSNGTGMPTTFQRTTQDLAYSLTGPTMYYYLTRDENILNKILKVKEFVLNEYYYQSDLSENSKLMMWVKEDFENDHKEDKQLLAVLDQLNAYLVLIAPILPDTLSNLFLDDVKNLSYSLKDNFYNKKYNLFWGNLNAKVVGNSPTDFGHSIKSFWMLYLAGKLIKDPDLVQFAKSNALKLLEKAYLKESGSWATMYKDSTLAVDKSKIWWGYAELDQMAATLSLQDSSIFEKYLVKTYKFWESKMIDHINGELYIGLDEQNNRFLSFGLKTFHWKNGFHSLEHALIGHLSSANYYKNEVDLFFAFSKNINKEEITIRPYYFAGNIIDMDNSDFENPLFKNLSKTKVTFKDMH